MTSDFARAAAAAYRMREEFSTPFLAFDVFLPISVLPGLAACEYTTFCNLNGITMDKFLELAPSEDGFSFRRRDEYLIIYNSSPDIPKTRQRFTIAHELGHYVLKHHAQTDTEEREADCFARNLLAPRRLALKYGVSFRDYPDAFHISAAAARMCERFREYDEQYI
jgi:hypothetical protein